MSERYGKPLPDNGDVIIPKLSDKRKRYSRDSELYTLEPVVVNGDIKIEDGMVYIKADIPMIQRRGKLTIEVNFETKEFRVVEGGN